MNKNVLIGVAVPALFAGHTLATAEEAPQGQSAIRLESTFIGDKEQPAVSYFIPWQGTRTPDKLQWNIEKKHDGTLDTVDRDVMQRSVTIYGEMQLENP